MKNVLIWGYNEFAVICGMFIKSRQYEKKYKYVGGYDINTQNRKKMIDPVDISLIDCTVDIVLTSSNIIQSVKAMCEEKLKIESVELIPQFITDNLNFHDKAVGSGLGFGRWIAGVNKFFKGKVNNFFEVGSNYSQDANFARCCFDIEPSNVYCFEANTRIAKEAHDLYPDYNIINCAISNENKDMELYIVPDNEENSGISTVIGYSRTEGWEKETVKCIRLEDYLKEHSEITSIDFLKVDVEGLNYEVLDGLGELINIVKCIQIEGEFLNYHEKYCFKDIALLLYKRGFEMVDFVAYTRQNDSLWIKRDLLNTIPVF